MPLLALRSLAESGGAGGGAAGGGPAIGVQPCCCAAPATCDQCTDGSTPKCDNGSNAVCTAGTWTCGDGSIPHCPCINCLTCTSWPASVTVTGFSVTCTANKICHIDCSFSTCSSDCGPCTQTIDANNCLNRNGPFNCDYNSDASAGTFAGTCDNFPGGGVLPALSCNVSFRCGVLTAVFNFGCASANCIGGEFAGASFYYQVYGLSLTDCEWDLDLPFVGSIITVDAGTPIWTCGAPSGSVHITSSASSC